MLVFIECCMQIYKNIHYYNSDDMIILCFLHESKGNDCESRPKNRSFSPFICAIYPDSVEQRGKRRLTHDDTKSDATIVLEQGC